MGSRIIFFNNNLHETFIIKNTINVYEKRRLRQKQDSGRDWNFSRFGTLPRTVQTRGQIFSNMLIRGYVVIDEVYDSYLRLFMHIYILNLLICFFLQKSLINFWILICKTKLLALITKNLMYIYIFSSSIIIYILHKKAFFLDSLSNEILSQGVDISDTQFNVTTGLTR